MILAAFRPATLPLLPWEERVGVRWGSCCSWPPLPPVMAGLVPAIHVSPSRPIDGDARNKSGHDVVGAPRKCVRTSRTGREPAFLATVMLCATLVRAGFDGRRPRRQQAKVRDSCSRARDLAGVRDPDHGALHGARLLREDRAMQRESGQASAAMMRGAGKITQARTTLSDARTTLRAGVTSRGIPLCPGESHIAFNACPNPTSGP